MQPPTISSLLTTHSNSCEITFLAYGFQIRGREKAIVRRHSREHEKWSDHTRILPPLKVGDHVYVQNLVGNHPKKWERGGVITELRQFHQYVVRIDGSSRVTLKNRQYLRKFSPFKKPS
ncbi:hypothetical protein RRG08_039436 [Elysia crispata]|uniref:Uncharacterized protein n=1 Tax=Elysia crispata TaxID=231223 RepID=A0AAE1ABF3_9GAST|nr:hypothetical protein RRG08_039436 [Elysia crispata]